MSATSETASRDSSAKYQASCPYIGMMSDPQTHVGIPDSRNCCHLVNPSMPVEVNYQQGFCLGQKFPDCPIYQTSGEGPIPDGILQAGSAERGFVLPFLGSRRATKNPRPATKEPKTQPIPEYVPEAIVAAKVASQAAKEPALQAKSEPATQQTARPEPQAVASTSAFMSVPASAATTAAAGASVPADKVSPGVDDDEEFRARLYNEALTRYEQVNQPKKERKGLWIFLLIAALLILLVSVWGVFNRVQNLQRQNQVQAEIGYTISLATAVQDMGAAADAWGTAASNVRSQQSTATAGVLAAAAAAEAAANAQATAKAAEIQALTATPTVQVGICQNLNEAGLTVVSGPELLPSLGTLYKVGMTPPQASWIIRNTGNCAWSQILTWSVFDNEIVQPIVMRDGQVVTPSANSGPIMIMPGEQIELVLQFPASSAQRIDGDWVMIVDGLSLVSQPHIILKANNWVILTLLETPRPTTRPKATSAPGSGGSGGSTEKPPTRETTPAPNPGTRP
jgi:hypothetical protein